MSANKITKTSETSSRACVNCQKRKSRCIRSGKRGDACSFCSRSGQACCFEAPPDRIPLTRQNLDAYEGRCAALEALLRSVYPGIDIDATLRDPEAILHPGSANPFVDAAERPASSPKDVSPCEFEWDETSAALNAQSFRGSKSISDGMGILTGHDGGYLGSTSGSSLLDDISSLIKQFSPSSPVERQRLRNSSPTSHSFTTSSPFDPQDLIFSAVAIHLIDAYFLLYHPSYPILHESAFRERAARVRAGPPSSWPVIYHMVLSIGHWICTTDEEHSQSRYYDAARSSLSIQMFESGSVETLQAFLLMSNYLQKRDKPNTGYSFMGVAYRLALGLGLHREPRDGTDTSDAEIRRRLFWIVYCFDSGFNITTGRPPSAADHSISTHLPRDINDKDFSVSLMASYGVECPTPVSALIAQSRLARITNIFFEELLLAKSADAKIQFQVSESLDEKLCLWQRNLPAYFISDDVPLWFLGPRAVVCWKQQNVRILLWRGTVRSHPFLPKRKSADQRCQEVALQSIHDITTFCRTHSTALHQGINWYATYFLFQAILVLQESILRDPCRMGQSEDLLVRRHSISKARDYLAGIASKHRPARRCLKMLDHLQESTLPSSAKQAIPAEQPQGVLGAPAAGSRFEQGSAGTTMANDEAAMFNEWASNTSVTCDASDQTLRMLVDQASLEWLGDESFDTLFADWPDPTAS